MVMVLPGLAVHLKVSETKHLANATDLLPP